MPVNTDLEIVFNNLKLKPVSTCDNSILVREKTAILVEPFKRYMTEVTPT